MAIPGVAVARQSEPQGKRRAIGAALLIAAACCVGATAQAIWNREQPLENTPGAARAVLEKSRDEKERAQAVTVLWREIGYSLDALRRAAAKNDRAAEHAREYLARLK